MKIAVISEVLKGEGRVAVSPDSVKRFLKHEGVAVSIQLGAGHASGYSDGDYRDAGATVSKTLHATVKGADIVLCVNAPADDVVAAIPKGAHLIGMLNPSDAKALKKQCKLRDVSAYAMELLPRISRAQSMDVLSSQSNLAGYRAVIDAVATSAKVVPMMMTAAGTVLPAKILVLGAGVAGLQAIATAKRLGAVVSAFDVRPAVKEQVESLGGKFIEVEDDAADGEDAGGYAKEMSDDYKRRQAELLAKVIAEQDVVITTALIPGRAAPELITKEMVESMKAGSVIVDLAAIAGGNCKLTKADKITTYKGVDIIGYTNMSSRTAMDASSLYARNLYNFVSLLFVGEDGALDVKYDDELVSTTLIVGDVPEQVVEEEASADEVEAEQHASEETNAGEGE